ncbi:MAG: T9SS type A sorting domain-containing protein [Bacteroidota bacterium]
MINYINQPIKASYGILLLFLTFFIQLNYAYSQCEENLLLNGSFTSLTGKSTVAPSWNGNITPDVNDASGFLNTSSDQYNWTGEIISSPNGGTWQNIFGPESVYQSVVLEMGASYQLCIEYAAQGISANPELTFNQPVGIRFIINDSTYHTSPKDSTQFTWERACIQFNAIDTLNKIEFQPNDDQYLGIDGACLKADLTSSTSIFKEKKFSYIYPNPVSTNSQFYHKTNIDLPFTLRIFNNLGSMIFHKENISSKNLAIPMKISISGIYYYSIEYGNNKVTSGRFIIQ